MNEEEEREVVNKNDKMNDENPVSLKKKKKRVSKLRKTMVF